MILIPQQKEKKSLGHKVFLGTSGTRGNEKYPYLGQP